MRAFRLGFVGWVSLLAVGACGQVDSSKRGNDAPAPAASGAGGQAGTAGTGVAAAGGTAGAVPTSGGSGASASTTGGSSPAGGSEDLPGSAGEGVGGAGGAPDTVDEPGGAGGVLNLPPLPGPHPYRAVQIATGRYHSCALLEDHRVKCWGNNGYGQLGVGDALPRGLDPALMGNALPAIDLGTGRSALAIAAGRYTTCAILDDHSAKCWGLGVLHEPGGEDIGDAPGEMGDALAPLPLGGHQAKALGLGFYDACVARDDDSYFCGGTSAQFGDVAAATDAHLLSMSADSAAIGLFDDGSVRHILSAIPGGPSVTLPAAGDPVELVAGSRELTCAYRQSHALKCSSDRLPTELPAVRSIALTEQGILCGVLSAGGGVRCWGNVPALPWSESVAMHEIDLKLPAPAAQVSSSSDEYHCALLVDGRVTCWSWVETPSPGVGWNQAGATAIQAVDLGIYPGP